MNVIYVDDERSAHINFYYGLKDRPDITTSAFFFTAAEAIEHAKTNRVDCAFLDVALEGTKSGLDLATTLKEMQPHLELAFVTCYDEYARDAFRVGGRCYLTKPYTQDELNQVLDTMGQLHKIHELSDEPVLRPQAQVLMRTFRNFDMLVNHRPIPFKNAKAKELLAFLVHQRGGSVSSVQLFLALWEHLKYTSTTSTYVRRTVRALRDELESHDLGDILICKRNCYSVDTSRFRCDCYSLIAGDQISIDSYHGEYMNQYSWGESTIPFLDRKTDQPK